MASWLSEAPVFLRAGVFLVVFLWCYWCCLTETRDDHQFCLRMEVLPKLVVVGPTIFFCWTEGLDIILVLQIDGLFFDVLLGIQHISWCLGWIWNLQLSLPVAQFSWWIMKYDEVSSPRWVEFYTSLGVVWLPLSMVRRGARHGKHGWGGSMTDTWNVGCVLWGDWFQMKKILNDKTDEQVKRQQTTMNKCFDRDLNQRCLMDWWVTQIAVITVMCMYIIDVYIYIYMPVLKSV